MFKIFGKRSKENILEINLKEPVDCVCDFTYNFYWQHKGEKLDPTWKIPDNDYTFADVVEHLKGGDTVKINGDVGHRLCSSMGVDLKYFGGSGSAIKVGKVIVDGNVDTRMGISMVMGEIYVKEDVKEPIGNLVEVDSDIKGYRKFRSITDIMMHGLGKDRLTKNKLMGNTLLINDGIVRDTVGARLDKDVEVIVDGDVDLSTGILMRNGIVRVHGDAGYNTGALLNGGTVIIDGNTGDFTGVDMKSGTIIVNGDAGKFLGAKKKNGVIFAKKGSPIPPTKKRNLRNEDKMILVKHGFNPRGFSRFE